MLLLDNNSPRLTTPPNTLITLKNHQQAMLYKMTQIEEISNIGIMSDYPGSGKSFVILSLILWDKLYNDKTQNILVVPHNLFTQWVNYIKLFPRLSFIKFIEYSDISNLLYNTSIIHKADILLTTSLYYSTICMSLPKNYKIKRIIIDEIDSSDFFINKKLPSDITWFVSASFDVNKIGKNTITQNINDITCKCQDSFIQFNIPIPNYIIYNCFDEFADMNVFNGDLQNQINAMDYNIQFENLSKNPKNSKELLNLIIKDSLLSIEKYEEYLKNDTTNEIYKKELIKYNNKIKNLFDRINESMCPICLEDFNYTTIKMFVNCCENVFCKECLKSSIIHTNNKCPKCRAIINLNNLIEIKENIKDEIKENIKDEIKENKKDKIECFKNILNISSNNSKIIIFSDYQNIFKALRKILEEKGIVYSELDGGNINDIDKSVDLYKNGNIQVLLINSSLYGAGLNFENTTDVILLHKSPNQQQIIGRAQRPGRISNLNIHCLLYENENN